MDTIVLIEDDPGIRTVIRLALKGAGFTSICEAGNGTDGLALVQRERPALVILDLMLPGMDGLAVCSAIRRTPSVSGTPIVVLTARTAEEDVVRGLELGADDYITKPFSKAILVARVKAALRRTSQPKGPIRTLGALVLDETTRTASIDGAALLRDAMAHPEKYPDLQVRVCGWNVRWNSLSRWEQEHFLRTALAQEGR